MTTWIVCTGTVATGLTTSTVCTGAVSGTLLSVKSLSSSSNPTLDELDTRVPAAIGCCGAGWCGAGCCGAGWYSVGCSGTGWYGAVETWFFVFVFCFIGFWNTEHIENEWNEWIIE